MSQRISSTAPFDGLPLVDGFETPTEFSDPVEQLDTHLCNDHFALVYESRTEALETIVPFVQHGLGRDERCMCVIGDLAEDEVDTALREAGTEINGALDSGQVTFHTIEETYLRNGHFEPDEMIDLYAEVAEVAAEEYEGLRIVADTTWLHGETTTIEKFMDYEAKVNALFDTEDCVALCLYDRSAFEPEVVRDVIRTHPHLVYDGTVCHNLYYTPPEQYFGPDEAARDVERMMNTLVERTEAKTALGERQRYQRQLYEITAAGDRTFEEKVEAVLDLGCERFGLEQGYLGQFHEDGDTFETEQFVPHSERELDEGIPHPQPNDGQFCRRALDEDEPIGAADVRDLGWDDDPVFRDGGLQSYFGVKVTDGASPYGVLAFCDTSPRERPYTDAEHTFLELMGQWVSHGLEQRRRETQLAALNVMSRELMGTETPAAIADVTVEHAHGSLQLPVTTVFAYDDGSGQLSAAAQTPAAGETLPTAAMCGDTAGLVWEVFVTNEGQSVEAGDGDRLSSNGLTQLIALPLAQQGVFVTATTTPGGFDSTERDFIETAAATVEAAWTRTDREQLLAEREKTLATQNETLERLNRINTTIRDIDQALIQASTRSEIETVVCEQLATVGPYELAWVGEHDPVTDEVTPREWAGTDNGYLEDRTVTADDDLNGRGPAGRAIRTHEPQVVNNILTDRSFEPWRQAALNRGYHACIGLPLVYGDSLYGVLKVYAGQPNVFDELEQVVLAELADTIAYAINAVESKKALLSDELTELEFSVDSLDQGITDFVRTTDCELSLESLVPRSDGAIRLFFSTHGVPARDVLEGASQLPVTDLTVVSEATDGDEPVCLFDATLTGDSVAETVLDHGGELSQFHATAETTTITVQLAADAEVREFVDMFRTKYPDATLTAQRSRQRADQPRQGCVTMMKEELTARQLEVLQTAYFNGYFEEPRTRTATAIAATLEITQPTFNSHIRTTQRKLLAQLFEE